MSDATKSVVSLGGMPGLDRPRTILGVRRFMAAEGGLLLASPVFGGMAIVINERGDIIPLPFPSLTPVLARVAGEDGARVLLTCCGHIE